MKRWKRSSDRHGFGVDNYGMTAAEDKNLVQYVQGRPFGIDFIKFWCEADFVVTGCGTGEGAMLALNSFPGVFILVTFKILQMLIYFQINAGNAHSVCKKDSIRSEITVDSKSFERLFLKKILVADIQREKRAGTSK